MALAPVLSFAQSYPSKPVRVIVPWSAGGSTDLFARMVFQRLAKVMGQQFVIDNRPGAAGTIGAGYVAKQAPDGYTLLVGTNSTHVMAPYMYKSLPYDQDKAFAPVMLMTTMPQVIAVHPSVPAKSLKEFIDYARQRPGQLNFSSAGYGGTSYLSTSMFMREAKIVMEHIPYKGGAPSLEAVYSGTTSLTFVDSIAASSPVKTGMIRALAITSKQRLPLMPDVPTVSESALPGFDTHTSQSLFAPAGTPREIITQLNTELRKLLNEPEMRKLLAEQGLEIVASAPEEYVAYQRNESEKWGRIIRELKITME
jgi:tripartite-type tricarboxylate transporter receptor subunit TctC